MTDFEFLDTAELDDRALSLTYGITVSKGRTNKLLRQLGQIFEEAYLMREGKITALPGTAKKEPEIDFTQHDADELAEAFIHFKCLAAAFEQNARESSARFCHKLAFLIFNGHQAQTEMGHA